MKLYSSAGAGGTKSLLTVPAHVIKKACSLSDAGRNNNFQSVPMQVSSGQLQVFFADDPGEHAAHIVVIKLCEVKHGPHAVRQGFLL